MSHVTFIHGIANKPPEETLLQIWKDALAFDGGINLDAKGISSSMVYWADVLYAAPAGTGAEEGLEGLGLAEGPVYPDDENLEWVDGLEGDEKSFVEGLSKKLDFEAESPGGDDFTPDSTLDPGFEAIPLPWFIKRRLMKVLLRDVHHYLFNVEYSPRPGETFRVQDDIRRRLVGKLEEGGERAGDGRHILVSHSMGTVISYDCLKRVPDCPAVDGLMTIGCPLGISEVQHKLKPEWSRDEGYPTSRLGLGEGRWRNVYDRLDPVSFDTHLADDYRRGGDEVVIDQRQHNGGKWRHDIERYLRQDHLRMHLAALLDLDWQP